MAGVARLAGTGLMIKHTLRQTQCVWKKRDCRANAHNDRRGYISGYCFLILV